MPILPLPVKRKFNTNQFNGQMCPGTVWIIRRNNEPIWLLSREPESLSRWNRNERGENNDYTIEYSIGQITFTTKRLITVPAE